MLGGGGSAERILGFGTVGDAIGIATVEIAPVGSMMVYLVYFNDIFFVYRF